MNIQKIKSWLETAVGSQFRKWIEEQISDLENINNVERYDDKDAQLLEFKATQLAVQKLKEIFGIIIDFKFIKKGRTKSEKKKDSFHNIV